MHAGASKYRTNDKKMRELDVKSIKAEALGKSKVCYCARICCHFIHSNNRLAYIYTIESEIKTLRLGHPVIAREISDVYDPGGSTHYSVLPLATACQPLRPSALQQLHTSLRSHRVTGDK